MREVALYEAKIQLTELLARVEQGEQITITRDGFPVAKLVAASAQGDPPTPGRHQRVAAALAQLKERSRGVTLDAPLRDAIDSGRD